jgi:Kef-type K+ transport system membrane component KefB
LIQSSIPTLLLIAAIAVAAPLGAERLKTFNVPGLVLEILLGIMVNRSAQRPSSARNYRLQPL